MALFRRLLAAVLIVNLGVLTVFVGLLTLQFDNIRTALVSERLVVLADRIAAPFQAAATIGLPLSNVRNAGSLLERARVTDEAISAIHVFDAAGRIVQSTEAKPPDVLPPAALAARAAAHGASWHHETPDAFFGSMNLKGPGNSDAGGILVVYPTEGSITRVWVMTAELVLAGVIVLAATAVIGGMLLRIALAPQVRAFEGIDAALTAFERDAWRSGAGGALPATETQEPENLRRQLREADVRYQDAGQAIAAMDRQETP